MRNYGASPTPQAAEVENSRNLFADFEQSQAPYKTALNIWISRDFDNKFAEEYLTLSGSNLVEQIRPEGRSTPPPKYRETINKAAKIHNEKGFFHWDLEFPEAFVDLRGGRWKSRDEQGFDAVVGNPPYVNVKRGIKLDFSVFAKARYRLASGQWDMGELFYELALEALLKTNRPVGLIVYQSLSFYQKTTRSFVTCLSVALIPLTMLRAVNASLMLELKQPWQ